MASLFLASLQTSALTVNISTYMFLLLLFFSCDHALTKTSKQASELEEKKEAKKEEEEEKEEKKQK